MTDLSYEMSLKSMEFFEKGGYELLKNIIKRDYDKLFKHNVAEIIMSEEDKNYLKENVSDRAFERLMDAIEGYNKKRKEDEFVDRFYLHHAWDIKYCDGTYDNLIYGDDIKIIRNIMKKYGFTHTDYELDRKYVEDLFCCSDNDHLFKES